MFYMRGTYWAQQPREKSIQPTQFVTNLVSALQTYHSEVRRFPQHIMVFRGGVIDDQYEKVATVEFGAFKAAFKELEQKHTDFQPPQVTIIANVRAGTVVDEHFVNPMYTEFLLVAHQAIRGTPIPSRYTVVVDTCSPRVPLEELEYVSYHLCYAHGIVCSPTSVPALLMAAADLKKRGRNNWNVAKSVDPISEAVRFTEDGSERCTTSTLPWKWEVISMKYHFQVVSSKEVWDKVNKSEYVTFRRTTNYGNEDIHCRMKIQDFRVQITDRGKPKKPRPAKRHLTCRERCHVSGPSKSHGVRPPPAEFFAAQLGFGRVIYQSLPLGETKRLVPVSPTTFDSCMPPTALHTVANLSCQRKTFLKIRSVCAQL
ncbi:piwi domain-containing protein [Ditylenchus destructor]|nr:piwi domain-containing protein [Ditylenchus destructor]